MKEFKRKGVTPIIPIQLTTEEKKARAEANEEFVKEMEKSTSKRGIKKSRFGIYGKMTIFPTGPKLK